MRTLELSVVVLSLSLSRPASLQSGNNNSVKNPRYLPIACPASMYYVKFFHLFAAFSSLIRSFKIREAVTSVKHPL